MRKRYVVIFILLLVANGLLRKFVLGPEWQDGNLLINVFIALILTFIYAVIVNKYRQKNKQ